MKTEKHLPKVYPVKSMLYFSTTLFMLVSILGIYPTLFAQPHFKNIHAAHGLSQNSPVAMAVDSTGYIWIATQDGLNRYDGDKFLVFDKHFSDVTRSQALSLGKLLVDKNNFLFFIPSSMVLEYRNPYTGKFTSLTNITLATALYLHPNGDIWVGRKDGSIIILNSQYHIIKYIPPLIKGVKENTIHHIIQSEKGSVYVVSEMGIFNYNTIHEKSKKIHITSDEVKYTYILSDHEATWVATMNDGIFKKNHNKNHFEKFTGFNDYPIKYDLKCYQILASNDSTLWFITYSDGLLKMNKKSQTIDYFKLYPNYHVNNIHYNYFLTAIQLPDNQILFGSDGEGIFQYSNGFIFKSIKKSDAPAHITFGQARCILSNENVTYIGTWQNGLIKITEKNGQRLWDKVNPPPYQNLNNIICLQKDHLHRIWIGTTDQGLFTYDEKKGEITKIKLKKKDTVFGDLSITDIKNDNDGNLWVATQDAGIIKIDGKGNILHHIHTQNSDLSTQQIRCLYIKDQIIYIGTDHAGIFEFNIKNNKCSPIYTIDKLVSKYIKSLTFDTTRNILWAGSTDNGIIGIDTLGHQIHFNTKNGLINNTVYGILLDHIHDLWISTNKGITKILFNKIDQSLLTPSFIHFGISEGLQSLEFNTGAYCKENDRKFIFGGVYGISYFDPHDFKEDVYPTKCYLHKILINGQPFTMDTTIEYIQSLQLRHDQNNIYLSASSLHFGNNMQPKYRYTLQGTTDQWQYDVSDNDIIFTEIKPGNYIVHISCSYDGKKWINARPLHIEIKPNWYATWWFYALAFILLTSIIIVIHNYRVSNALWREKLKYEFRQQAEQLELKALRSQMNPHFIFNCLNAIENLVIKRDTQVALNYLHKYSKLIRYTLEYSKNNVINLDKEIFMISLYLDLESLRFNKQFEYKIDIDNRLKTSHILIPPFVIQPMVENAIKHGLIPSNAKSFLNIKVYENSSFIICEIIDNGIGLIKAYENKTNSSFNYTSLGISNTQQRLKLIYPENYTEELLVITELTDDLGQKGTQVTIRFPKNTVI